MKALSKVIILSLLVVMLFSHEFGEHDLHHSSAQSNNYEKAQSN